MELVTVCCWVVSHAVCIALIRAVDMEVGGGSEVCRGCIQLGNVDAVLAAAEVEF